MRRAFSDALVQIARQDDKVIFLTGDLGFGVFDQFITEFPRRYINVGVAEAQLVDCAAGLALEGWRPIVYSIASFMTGRAYEQIRLAIGYHRLPVLVVGAGGGYTYADAGVTHHAKEDLALMALVANMTVVAPGDPNEVAELMPQLLRGDGPSYIRIGRFGEPRFESAEPIVVGRARFLSRGERIAILTTGGSVIHALRAVEQLGREGIRPTLCHFHTVRPLDQAALGQLDDAGAFVVVEEHGVQGGLAAAVAAWCLENRRAPRVVRLGPGDDLVLGNPKQQQLSREAGFDDNGIAAACRRLWSETRAAA
ncbi:MAG: transketolase [Alphaproteobacteria bacterium]|nr:transketolase [Alphaproteobacteria bacterium]